MFEFFIKLLEWFGFRGEFLVSTPRAQGQGRFYSRRRAISDAKLRAAQHPGIPVTVRRYNVSLSRSSAKNGNGRSQYEIIKTFKF
jgi:hypothetical protein